MVCFSFSFIFLPLPNLCEQLTVWSVSSFPSTARRHLGGKQCLSCQPPEPAADHSACSRHMPASLLLPPGYWRHTESSAGQIHLKKKRVCTPLFRNKKLIPNGPTRTPAKMCFWTTGTTTGWLLPVIYWVILCSRWGYTVLLGAHNRSIVILLWARCQNRSVLSNPTDLL